MVASETVGAALRAAAEALTATGEATLAGTARLDAELLMARALGVGRSELLLRYREAPVPEDVGADFAAMLARRLAHEPVAYILGETEFYGLTLAVSPAVLIPRADSEVLIEAARAAFAARATAPARVLDLGTGSGCLLLAALSLWPEAHGVGLDRSAAALAVAGANARRLGLALRAEMRPGDWREPGWQSGLLSPERRFDLILANPPYVESGFALEAQVRDYEPAGALFAGPEGLDDYRLLLPRLPDLLAVDGFALIEIGHGQAGRVGAMAREAGLECRLHRDLGGRARALELGLKPGGDGD